MFMNPERREAAEIATEANWKLWHKRKKWLFGPLKLAALAVALSFTYYTGEHAGVEICAAPPAQRESM